MPTAQAYSSAGQETGQVNLPEALFGAEVNSHVLYEAIKSYLGNQRQGTHKTKNRHEVSGQKSKLNKQKGTGRARVGSATSGTRVGGSGIFGPRPPDYRTQLPARVRRQALLAALSDRAAVPTCTSSTICRSALRARRSWRGCWTAWGSRPSAYSW